LHRKDVYSVSTESSLVYRLREIYTHLSSGTNKSRLRVGKGMQVALQQQQMFSENSITGVRSHRDKKCRMQYSIDPFFPICRIWGQRSVRDH
jgi:hypothetical protein